MIQAQQFVEAARAHGFQWYTGVPCSFLTPFINYVIGDPGLQYVSAPNEGDAVALAAGTTLGGQRAVVMLQNSGLGNAVSPLSSLTWTFHLPVLLIITWRGEPGLKDEPQHELMGQITGSMLDTLEIPWALFPDQAEDIAPVLERANHVMNSSQRPFALIMRKGTVAPEPLRQTQTVCKRPETHFESRYRQLPLAPRRRALAALIEATAADSIDTVLLATTGFTGRELFASGDRPNQLYMVGSMGCVSALGLGLALARPDLRVVVLDGDGAALMRLGNFALLGAYGGANLVHLLLDNGVHDSTGGQETLAAAVSLAGVAQACGYARVLEGDDPALITEILAPAEGPRFLQLKIQAGTEAGLPRPDVTPVQVKERFMAHIGAQSIDTVE